MGRADARGRCAARATQCAVPGLAPGRWHPRRRRLGADAVPALAAEPWRRSCSAPLSWLASPWCVAEAMLARERGKRLFLLATPEVADGRQVKGLQDGGTVPQIPDFLKDTQFISLAGATEEEACARLWQGLAAEGLKDRLPATRAALSGAGAVPGDGRRRVLRPGRGDRARHRRAQQAPAEQRRGLHPGPGRVGLRQVVAGARGSAAAGEARERPRRRRRALG
ncbi:MAG: hypothetical protein MZV65_49120 [Chromatiales bacterium]|nr:hypothetical protein [Chromatiales bacterium]